MHNFNDYESSDHYTRFETVKKELVAVLEPETVDETDYEELNRKAAHIDLINPSYGESNEVDDILNDVEDERVGEIGYL